MAKSYYVLCFYQLNRDLLRNPECDRQFKSGLKVLSDHRINLKVVKNL